MKNYVQPGNNITAIVPVGGINSGDPLLIDHLFGVASTTQLVGEEVELGCVGVYELPKATGAITAGAIAYWDDTAKNVTTVSLAHLRIGIFILPALEAALTARVRLDGMVTVGT